MPRSARWKRPPESSSGSSRSCSRVLTECCPPPADSSSAVPRLARSAIEPYVQHDLARHVTMRELTFNPFTLVAVVRGFALSEADGAPIASFDLFRVGMSLRSVVNRAWTFSELRLDRPQLSVLVNSDGLLNLAK